MMIAVSMAEGNGSPSAFVTPRFIGLYRSACFLLPLVNKFACWLQEAGADASYVEGPRSIEELQELGERQKVQHHDHHCCMRASEVARSG